MVVRASLFLDRNWIQLFVGDGGGQNEVEPIMTGRGFAVVDRERPRGSMRGESHNSGTSSEMLARGGEVTNFALAAHDVVNRAEAIHNIGFQ